MKNKQVRHLTADRGILLVLSGPSGVGKGTVCAALRNRLTELRYSISATTRAPRQGEVEGVNYFFKTKAQFLQMIEDDELLEWAEYVGNYYGTPQSYVEETLAAGNDIILEIDVQGALKLKEKFSDGVFIFLLPPTLDELYHRIVARGTENTESIHNRMMAANDELRFLQYYHYAVVNDQVDSACDRIHSILVAEQCRKERVLNKIQKWMDEV